MRAVLLAIATATTFAGLRASSCVTQGYFSGWARACLKTASAPTIRMRRKYWSPCFEIGPSRCLPPVESSRGTMPIQAAKSRPVLKIEASGTVATMALAPMTPMLGMVSSRLLSAFLRCCARRRFSIAPISAWQEAICATSADRLARILGQAGIAGVGDDGKQLLEAFVALCRNDAELGHVRAQCIDALCALTNHQITHAVLHEPRLLIDRLHRHGTDRRSSDGLAARRSIDRIVLAALDVRHHVLGRHQPYIMPELLELARPVVGRRTRFHADQARRELGEEGYALVLDAAAC